jgi:hypothetical protein
MVIVELADLLSSAVETALIVTIAGLGTFGGAVYKPAGLIVPQAVPLHPVPERLQVTPLFVELRTVAIN